MIPELATLAGVSYGIYKLFGCQPVTTRSTQSDETTDTATDIDEVVIHPDRPQGWKEFVGNDAVVEGIKVSCEFSKKEDVPMSNILLLGAAGTGKTTLARIIAKEMDYRFIDMNGTTMSSMVDVYNTVQRLAGWIEAGHKTILFLDEIHALDRGAAAVRETLKPLIEEHIFKANMIKLENGAWRKTRPWSHQLPPFTVIGATDQDIQDKAMRSRFRVYEMVKYTQDEIGQILQSYCKKTHKVFEDDAVALIADRCRLNPRLAIHHVNEIWEYTVVSDLKIATLDQSYTVLQDRKKTYQYGLTDVDIRYMSKLRTAGRPVGENTLRKTLRLPDTTFQEIEGLLFDLEFVDATPRGRKITDAGIGWLALNR